MLWPQKNLLHPRHRNPHFHQSTSPPMITIWLGRDRLRPEAGCKFRQANLVQTIAVVIKGRGGFDARPSSLKHLHILLSCTTIAVIVKLGVSEEAGQLAIHQTCQFSETSSLKILSSSIDGNTLASYSKPWCQLEKGRLRWPLSSLEHLHIWIYSPHLQTIGIFINLGVSETAGQVASHQTLGNSGKSG